MSDPGARAADIAVLAIERLIRRIYQQASDEIVDKMNEHLEKYKAKDREWEQQVADGQATEREWQLWRKGQMFTGKRWLNLQRKCTGMMLFANQKANAIVEGKRLGVFAENINYQNFCFDRDSGYSLGIDFTLYDEHTVDRLIRDRPELLPRREVDGKKDMAWNRVKISNAVTQSILQGDSIDDLAKRIGRTTGITNKSAMLRYAMTGAQNGGRIEAMEQAQAAGINVRKKWIATLDAKTRDAHQHLDGEVQEVEKPFKSSLGDIMYPGDPAAKPANVYNCRCTLGYDYPEYSTGGLRRAYNDPESRESEVVEDQTYREWKERKSLQFSGSNGIMDTEGKGWRNNELHYSREDRKRLVQIGVDAPEPVFSYDTPDNPFPSMAKRAEPDPKYPGMLDIISHGTDTTVDLFGEPIDGYILASVMMSRHDHTPGQGFRLLSCYTGVTDRTGDCVAQILSNQTNEMVLAPVDLVYTTGDGKVYVKGHEHDEDRGWHLFYPRGKEE